MHVFSDAFMGTAGGDGTENLVDKKPVMDFGFYELGIPRSTI